MQSQFQQAERGVDERGSTGSPKLRKSFMLHVDASQVTVGGTVTQEDREGRTCVIAYASKKLSSAQLKYTESDGELLTLGNGLPRLRCYQEGSSFSVITYN